MGAQLISLFECVNLSKRGRAAEIEVLSLFASSLRKLGTSFERDDPYIKFTLNGRKWTIQHFYPRQKGVLIKGLEHNADLVAWSDEDYVAYIEVKNRSRDLNPGESRKFVGKVLFNHADAALFVSMRSTINRHHILDRYGIRNTNHLLEARRRQMEYSEWPEFVVSRFIREDLGNRKVVDRFSRMRESRKGKAVELLRKHKQFNGIGFQFIEKLPSKENRYYIADEERVIHAPYAIILKDGESILIFKKSKVVTSDLYEAYATLVDLGADLVVFMEPMTLTGSAEKLFDKMMFLRMSENDIFQKLGVSVKDLPTFSWEEVARYPLNNLSGARMKHTPPCVRNALKGVSDGLRETALFLQTFFRACNLAFDDEEYINKCQTRIDKDWLGYEPSKSKKDTREKVLSGVAEAISRKINPGNLYCDMDTQGIKGPLTLDAVFHSSLCSPDGLCSLLQRKDLFEYVNLRLRQK